MTIKDEEIVGVWSENGSLYCRDGAEELNIEIEDSERLLLREEVERNEEEYYFCDCHKRRIIP